MVKVGELAPDFDALDCRGDRFQLSSFRGQRRVVLFFFPKAFTPACTAEVRDFRDHYERITTLNAELVGISVDKSERNCRFATEENLQFRLIGDESRVISEKFGVVWPILRVDRRATFLIGLDGRVADIFHHEVQVHRHLTDVLERLAATR